METKRNREWRRKQFFRVFKNRMKYQAAIASECVMEDGCHVFYPTWVELAKCHWAQVYKSTGTPCSCGKCRGESYNRRQAKKDTKALIEIEMGNY